MGPFRLCTVTIQIQNSLWGREGEREGGGNEKGSKKEGDTIEQESQ